MEVIIAKDAENAALLEADQLGALVRAKPAAVLGLATGSTPLGLYAELARRLCERGLDYSG